MDFSQIDDDFAKEIVRAGEAFLDGELKIATSADQRASSLAGVFTAAATALIAGSAALANPSWRVAGSWPLIIGAASAAIMFLLGAIQCWRSIMPAEFYLPGCEPENWAEDVAEARKLKICLGERADHIQKDITENRALIKGNAKKFAMGAIFGIVAPFVGVAAWAIAFCLLH